MPGGKTGCHYPTNKAKVVGSLQSATDDILHSDMYTVEMHNNEHRNRPESMAANEQYGKTNAQAKSNCAHNPIWEQDP